MYAKHYRARARRSLSGNWLLSALTVLIAGLFGGTLLSSGGGGGTSIDQDTVDLFRSATIPEDVQQVLITALMIAVPILIIALLISFLLGGVVRLGHAKFLLDQHDGKKLNIGTLFSQFHQYGNGFCLSLLTALYTALWALLFIIPGIVATFSYAMAPFIQAEHPEYTASESLRASKEMMRGHKWELFCLNLSFIGWAILCVFTLGIGNYFLIAYQSAAFAAFYRDLSAPTVIPEAIPAESAFPEE